MNAHKHKYADAHKLTRVGMYIYIDTYLYVYVDAYMRIRRNTHKNTFAQKYIDTKIQP